MPLTTKSQDKLIDTSIKALTIGAILFFGKKLLTGVSRLSAESQALTDPAVQQAMSSKQAMNPSGFDFMMSFDTTNVPEIFATASEINNLNKVGNKYRSLYNRSLIEDLQKELSPDDYRAFLKKVSSSVSTSPGGSTSTSNSPTGQDKPLKVDFKFKVGQVVWLNRNKRFVDKPSLNPSMFFTLKKDMLFKIKKRFKLNLTKKGRFIAAVAWYQFKTDHLNIKSSWIKQADILSK